MLTRLEKTAFHESGHAVVGVVLGCTVAQVSVVEDKDNLGVTHVAFPANPALRATVLMAGPLSQAKATGDPVEHNDLPHGDLHQALDPFIAAGYSQEAAARVINQCSGLAELYVRENWSAIDSMARLLQSKDCLGRNEIQGLLEQFRMDTRGGYVEYLSSTASQFADTECLENGPYGYSCRACGREGKVHILKKSGRLLCANCCPCGGRKSA
jgi:hypothetical protein